MANRVSFIIIAKDAFTKVGKKIASVTGKMKSGFSKLNHKLKVTTGRFDGLVTSALAFFGIKKFFGEGIKFQSSMAELAAITGAVGDEFDFLQDKILKMAKTNKLAQAEVAAAVKLVGSAKPELLKTLPLLIKTTEQVLLLANTGVPIEQAATIVTESLNQFGKGADFAAKFVNILAAGSLKGSSEIANTGAAVLLAGANARAAGLDFKQLNALIQTTSLGGIKGSQAGTAISAILGRLRRQGFDFEKLGLEGVFNKVAESLLKIKSSTRRATKEAELFGEEHGKVGLALVNNRKLLSFFENALGGTNVAQEQANILLASFSAKLRGVNVTINDTLIKTFLKLEEVSTFSNLADDFSKWADAMDESDIRDFADTIRTMVDSVILLSKGLKISFLLLKGVGIGIGELIGRAVTGTSDIDLSTSLEEAFSVDRIVNILNTEVAPLVSKIADTTINVASSVSTKVVSEVTVPDIRPMFITSEIVLPKEVLKVKAEVIPQDIIQGNQPSAAETIKNQVMVKSQADVNINIKAPRGVVSSVKATAKTPNLRVGVNMETTG